MDKNYSASNSFSYQTQKIMHTIKSTWVDKMAFDNQLVNHIVRTDTVEPLGIDSGASPKRLVLAGLAGCSGIDVVSVLNKMRVKFDSFTIDVEADLTEEHPKVYSHIRMTYRFTGENLNAEKIKKAVDLSILTYCGVSAMLRKNCPIDYEIILN